MKAYALSALSVVAIVGLVIATPMMSRAAGFGAAAGISKAATPSVDLAGCFTSSIEPTHMVWLACGTPGSSGGGSGSNPGPSSSSSGASSSSGTSSSGGGIGGVGGPRSN